MSMITKNGVSSVESFNELSAASKLVVIFGASWCKPCAALKPVLLEISEEVAYESLPFIELDVDTLGMDKICNKYSVRGVPTILMLDKGKEVNRITGSCGTQKIREELNNFNK